jgi:hypothetical protein
MSVPLTPVFEVPLDWPPEDRFNLTNRSQLVSPCAGRQRVSASAGALCNIKLETLHLQRLDCDFATERRAWLVFRSHPSLACSLGSVAHP